MFLRRLTIEDVRAVEYLDLKFEAATSDDGDLLDRQRSVSPGPTRQWTWLLGENGCGKSTVLRSAALLLAGSEALSELIGQADSWVRRGAEAAKLSAELVTLDGDFRSVSVVIRRGAGVKEVYRENAQALDELDAAIDQASDSYFTAGYGGARRVADAGNPNMERQRGTSPFRTARAGAVATLFTNGATLNSLETWAMDLDYRHENGLEVVREALDGLLPGISFSGIDKNNSRLMFDTADGAIPFDQLSDGYQNVAAWTGDLLYRLTRAFGDFADPFSARGLLLVDEIDLHLHPVWKRKLVEYLSAKLPHMQIIATTHSAVTVHQAGPGELFVLKRETADSSPALFPYPSNPRTLLLHQFLLSPAFGLTTMDSRLVEELKDEYRSLKAGVRKEGSAAPSLSVLAEALADLPDWSAETDRDREQRELLEAIQLELGQTAQGRHGKP